MSWDNITGKAVGGSGEKYVVLQVVLTEKIFRYWFRLLRV